MRFESRYREKKAESKAEQKDRTEQSKSLNRYISILILRFLFFDHRFGLINGDCFFESAFFEATDSTQQTGA